MSEVSYLLPAFALDFSGPFSGAKSPQQNVLKDRATFAALLESITDSNPILESATQLGYRVSINAPLTYHAFYEASEGDLDRAEKFSSEVQIGEAAIAFSARPIVAPSPLNYRPETADEMAPANSADAQKSGVLQVLIRSIVEPTGSERASDREQGTAWIRSGGLQNLEAKPEPVASPFRTLPNTQRAHIAQAVTYISHGSNPIGWNEAHPSSSNEVRSLSGPVRISGTLLSPEALAHFQSGSQEYLLSLRGIRLTQSERDRLLSDINATLFELGMPLQPLRFTQPEGK